MGNDYENTLDELKDFIGGGYYTIDKYDKDLEDPNFRDEASILEDQLRSLLFQHDKDSIYDDVKGGKVAYASLNAQDKITFDQISTGYLNTLDGTRSEGLSRNDWGQMINFFAGRITADQRDARNEEYKLRRPPIEDQLIGSMKAMDEGILGE